MKCRQVEELLPLYTKNELDSPTARMLAAHLQFCTSCAQFTEEYKAVRQMLTYYQPPEFSAMLHEEIRRNVLSEIKKQPAKSALIQRLANLLFRPKLVGLIPALALLMFGIIGFLSLDDLTENNSALATLEENSIVTEQSPPEPKYEVKSPAADPQRVTIQEEKTSKANVRNILRNRVRAVNSKPNIESRINYNQTAQRKGQAFGNPNLALKSEIPLDENQHGRFKNDSTLASASTKNALRMEIQTSNPNIRIILFSKK